MNFAQFMLLVQAALAALRLRRKELKKLRRTDIVNFFEIGALHQVMAVIPLLQALLQKVQSAQETRLTALCAVLRQTNADCLRQVVGYLDDTTFTECWENPTEEFIELLRAYQKVVEAFLKTDRYPTKVKLTPFSDDVLNFLRGRLDEMSYHKCFCEFVCRVDELEDTWNNCEYGGCCHYPASNQTYRTSILGYKMVERFKITGHPFPHLNKLSPYMMQIYEPIIKQNIRKKSVGFEKKCIFPDDINIFPKAKVNQYWDDWCHIVFRQYWENDQW